MQEIKLPTWAKFVQDHHLVENGKVSAVIEADPDGFVPEWLELIGKKEEDKITQYDLEVCFQCAKLDVQRALQGTDLQPSRGGKPYQLNILSRKEKWSLKNFPEGKGIRAATQGVKVMEKGKEDEASARAHYIRVRGAVPEL